MITKDQQPLGFHQKYHIDAKDEDHIDRFIQRLKRIEAK
ncbi:MAG: DUF3081 domain-containing protein [Pararheinheimera sp.]|nr:DUF3081 domain-containing protein [Rheinheimera sp.]